jgi:anaerobic selenocysteine-containing dehydrogenase
MKFETSSGKIEVYSSEAAVKWGISPLPEYKGIIHSHDEMKYPLELITPNTGSRIHSQFGNLKIIKETSPKPLARISPADAFKRNVLTGQKIRVFNQAGELIIEAEISNRVPKGLIILPNGIWLNEGGGVNKLVAGVETDIGFGAAFHDNRVDIEGVE